jgi:hypothetical protein
LHHQSFFRISAEVLFMQYPNLVARQIGPKAGKGHSFQAVMVNEEQLGDLRAAMSEPQVKAAHPFLQGNSGGWIMIEFWTKDIEVIDVACQVLVEALGVPLLFGDFTRPELGLIDEQ